MSPTERLPRRPRVFVDQLLNGDACLTLPPERSRHLGDVLRLKAGAPLVLFDGQGGEWSAVLEAPGKRATVRVHERLTNACESPLSITLWQGLSQGARMDACLRQGVELGITGFRPLLTQRSVGKPDARRAQKKHEHWSAIAISAAEQSGRATVPTVHALATPEVHLRNACDAVAAPDTLALVLLPDAATGLGAWPAERPPARIELMIGPESGLSEHEARAAFDAGFLPVRIGPRVLRTETAGPAAIAVLQARFGDLAP